MAGNNAGQDAGASLTIFVTLPVKPEQLDRYLELTLAEVHGARSETGNGAFFAYRNTADTNTLHLFEVWESEKWLAEVHGEKDYYKAMRGVEAEVLNGEVGERFLSEVAPQMPLPVASQPVPHARVTIIRGNGGSAKESFGTTAEALRAAPGNLGLWLFSVVGAQDEHLLLEHWSDADARARAVKGDKSGLFAEGAETLVLRDVLSGN